MRDDHDGLLDYFLPYLGHAETMRELRDIDTTRWPDRSRCPLAKCRGFGLPLPQANRPGSGGCPGPIMLANGRRRAQPGTPAAARVPARRIYGEYAGPLSSA